jgi:hypothetical protein
MYISIIWHYWVIIEYVPISPATYSISIDKSSLGDESNSCPTQLQNILEEITVF